MQDHAGRTPIYSLETRASYLNSNFAKVAEKGPITRSMVEMARLLVGKGARMDVRDRNKRTPLCQLAANAPGSVLDVLLEAGADPNAVEKHGGTPVRRALDQGNVEAVKTLVAHSARADMDLLITAIETGADLFDDVDFKDHYEETLRSYAKGLRGVLMQRVAAA